MEFIDSHTHLFSEKFNDDRDKIVEKAVAEGVSQMMLPNISEDTIKDMMELSNKFPQNCFPMLGLHPCDVKPNFESVLSRMKPLFSEHKFYGVGETGIDLHWDKTTLEIQKEALKIQIEWAKEFDLPIIIHARESYDELFEVFDRCNDDRLKGVFHCFTGTQKQAEHILNYGNFKLGIGGVVTFKNSNLGEILKHIEIENLLLETDSPYLAPHPNRGKRNESSYLIYVASKLAEVYEIPIQKVAEITTKSAKELFNL